MKTRILVLLMAVVVASRLTAAEPHCVADDTLRQCFNKFLPQWSSGPSEPSRMQRMTAAENTGVADLLAPSQTTTKDFLSMLAAALAVPMSGSSAKPVALDFNYPIRMLGGDDQRLNIRAVFARPELSADMKKRLAGNAAGLTTVKDSLSEIDDVTLSAALSPSTRWLGRSVVPHRQIYRQMLDAQIIAALAPAISAKVGDLDVTISKLAAADPAAIEAAARGGAEKVDAFQRRFAALLSNQPQVYGSVIYRARNSVAGPDERSANVRYEMGFHNLNKFYALIDDQCIPPVTDITACANDLMDLGKRGLDAPDDRVVFSIEYRALTGFTVRVPEHTIHYKTNPAHTFIYSLGYGRNHMMAKQGRLDLTVNYEDTTAQTATDIVEPSLLGRNAALADGEGKPVRDRFVATATYTYKINNMMSMPLSLTYANHASFLGEQGRKLNAHFGISVKMPSAK